MKRVYVLLTLIGGLGFVLQILKMSPEAAALQDVYQTYTNARFAYSLAYPANLLIGQGEATNGDGQVFVAKDGRAKLTVYGSHNALNQQLEAVFAEASGQSSEHPKRRVTYKIFKADWFVVSGTEAGNIFYQKTLLKNRIFKTFRIEYPESLKTIYDAVTAKVERSFKG